MIVRPKQSWFRLLFIWKGSVLQSIMPQLAFMTVVSCVAVATHGRVFGEKIPLSATLLTLFGLTLAIFLGFRNTASYQRFDEARHLWGQLLIASRALVSQALCHLPRDEANAVADEIIALVYALKHELRLTQPQVDLVRLLGRERARELMACNERAPVLLHQLRLRLAGHRDSGRLSDTLFWTMDTQLTELGRAVGGCERIASTPIPFAYGVLLHRTVYTYCVLLPFGLVDSAEVFTPLLCVFLSYTLIALEAIANEVSEPFGLTPHALALDAMSRNIERSVFELCGRELPPALEPSASYQLT